MWKINTTNGWVRSGHSDCGSKWAKLKMGHFKRVKTGWTNWVAGGSGQCLFHMKK